jgi:hypothetical protein
MYPSVSKYCAHCNSQYSTGLSVTSSIQILRTLHPLILHWAQCTHQYPNIAHSATLNTPLGAMYTSVSKYCAGCAPQYSTVRNVPISIQILRPLRPSVLHCPQCSRQHPPTAPPAPTRIQHQQLPTYGFTMDKAQNMIIQKTGH